MTYRTYHQVAGEDRSQLGAQVQAQRDRVTERLRAIGRIVAVMSGKGGVGKSYVTSWLARAAAATCRVGVLDADLQSPTVAGLLEASGPLRIGESGIEPSIAADGISVFSTDLLLDEGRPLQWRSPVGDPFAWRGLLEAGALREFLSDVAWGSLDLLLVDLPPGNDGMTDLYQLVPSLAGILAVTIPSDEARRSVARSLRAAQGSDMPILGVVENMSGYHCPGCERVQPLFDGAAGQSLADEFGVPLLGCLPFRPNGDGPEPEALAPVVGTVIGGLREVLVHRLR